ncbi:MAG: Cof-type HAD-IIB family hydrolase [Erysipelotrichaceae bacterium]
MYKLIACDLDETLLNQDKNICQRNIDAIKKAEDQYGVRFVPATGRGFTSIDAILSSLGTLNKENEYVISNNGGIITENKDNRILTFHELPSYKVKELIAYGFSKGICMQVFSEKDVYAYNLNEDERQVLASFKPDYIECKDESIEILKDKKIVKILFQKKDMTYLMKLAKEMEPITKDTVCVSFSSNRYLELNHIGIDKGLGLRELANYLNIDMKDTIAIGDNFNDIAMLQAAGLAIGVANVDQDVRGYCDFIMEADHNQGGVGEAIERFIFNEQKGSQNGYK